MSERVTATLVHGGCGCVNAEGGHGGHVNDSSTDERRVFTPVRPIKCEMRVFRFICVWLSGGGCFVFAY